MTSTVRSCAIAIAVSIAMTMAMTIAMSIGIGSASLGTANAEANPLPNVMVVLLDDIGTDALRVYGEDPNAAPTPNITALAERGVVFRHAWANPSCVPSRASLMSGELPRTNGVGTLATISGGLPAGHRTIASDLRAKGFRTFALGKWHLAPPKTPGHPRSLGFDYFAGTSGNLGASDDAYFNWTKSFDSHRIRGWKKYATSDTVDDALQQIAGTAPWFGYVALHAAHYPSHVPPPLLHSYGAELGSQKDGLTAYRATVEAADHELGRLFEKLPENTWLFVMSDNGSPPAVAQGKGAGGPSGKSRGKKTMYESGIRIPLIVSGPGVVPREVDALVHLSDVFATVLELVGGSEAPPKDSVSFAKVLRGAEGDREWVISEQFGRPEEERAAIRRGCLKLLLLPGEKREVYDLCADPFEQNDLLAARSTPAETESREGREDGASSLDADVAALAALLARDAAEAGSQGSP